MCTLGTFLFWRDGDGLQAAQVTFEAAQQLPGLHVPQPGHLIAGSCHLEREREEKVLEYDSENYNGEPGSVKLRVPTMWEFPGTQAMSKTAFS